MPLQDPNEELGTAMVAALLCLGMLLIGIAVAGAILRRGSQAIHGRRALPRDNRKMVLYVALGDSAVYGAGASEQQRNYVGRLFARLRTIYPHAQMVNLSTSGATVEDVVVRQLQHTVALRPDLITLSVGPNEIVQGRNVQDCERDLETIFRTLADETQAVVVMNLLPHPSAAPGPTDTTREQTALFNAALAHTAELHDVQIVDLPTPSQHELPKLSNTLVTDTRHRSDAGYAEWAELIWRGLGARLP